MPHSGKLLWAMARSVFEWGFNENFRVLYRQKKRKFVHCMFYSRVTEKNLHIFLIYFHFSLHLLRPHEKNTYFDNMWVCVCAVNIWSRKIFVKKNYLRTICGKRPMPCMLFVGEKNLSNDPLINFVEKRYVYINANNIYLNNFVFFFM